MGLRAIILPILAVFLTGGVCAQEVDSTDVIRTITIIGEGEVSAKPDIATIRIGVTSTSKTAQGALSANSAAMTKTIASIKQIGIKPKDLQTSNISLYPDYKYDRGSEEQRLDGYRSSNTLTVKVRDLDKVGQALEVAVASGANQVQGISFGFDDPKVLMNKARKAAVEDARSKAVLYAGASGVALGDILSISEPGAAAPQLTVRAVARAEFAADSSGVPVEVGENKIRSVINIVYEIE